TAAWALSGTTYWYWRNPRLPYRRFHPRTPSSGWKNAEIVSSSPWSSGVTRYHSSLKIAMLTRLSNPFGTHGGAPIRACGSKCNDLFRSFGGSSSRRAWSPRDRIERPSDAPLARQSIHATEYR